MNYPLLLIGHRGVRKIPEVEENTLAGFKTAFEEGANCIETDFRLTRDGKLVICHPLKAHKITYSQWQKLFPQSSDYPTTLEWFRHFLDLNPQKLFFLYLEIKDFEIDMWKMIKEITHRQLEKNILLASRHQEVIQKSFFAKESLNLPPKVLPVGLMFTGPVLRPTLMIEAKRLRYKDYKVAFLHPWFPRFFGPFWEEIRSWLPFWGKGFVERTKKNMMAVVMGSVGKNKPRAVRLLKYLKSLGVIGFTTDDPSVFGEIFPLKKQKLIFPDLNLKSPFMFADYSQTGDTKPVDQSHQLYLETCQRLLRKKRGPLMTIDGIVKKIGAKKEILLGRKLYWGYKNALNFKPKNGSD